MTSTFLALPDDDALWRYSIISPLLHRSDTRALCTEIKLLSQRSFLKPDGREVYLSADTLRSWLTRYRSGGIDALRTKQRKDRGSTSVPMALQDAVAELRTAQPQWTVQRILEELKKQGKWNGMSPGRSSLYRFTKANSLNRKKGEEVHPVRSFEFPHFGDLWSADFLHGPKVRQGTYAHKSYLHAIIDDATRYIVASGFHLAENTRSLMDDLMLAVRRFGIPKRFYTDNGSAFRSRHLQMVAAKLGMSLPHSPPYKPAGRGKIERFFRSVRDGFLSGRQKSTIKKLNEDFSEWLTLYHNRVHRTLKMSPLSRKLIDSGDDLKQIPATQNIDDIFRIEELKRIGTDGCIRLWGKRFEIPNALPKSTVIISYLPWQQDCIWVGTDKTMTKPLNTHKNALRFDKPTRGTSNQKEQNQ